MKIDFVRGMSDAKRWFRHSGLCVRNRMGQNVASAIPATADRKSPDQLAFRQAVKEAGRAWGALEEDAREAWNTYARRYGNQISEQLYKDLSGWEVFLPAFLSRSLLGSTPPPHPAAMAPPEAVTGIEEVAGAEDDTFSFRVTHALPPEGHVLIVRITPATATRARRPYARTARMIRGHGGDSVTPLPTSGGVVTFHRARFSIAPGQRFGVAMRIMRLEDGVVSREFFADLLRTEPPTDWATSPDPPPQKKAAAAPTNAPGSKATDKLYHVHEVHNVHPVPGSHSAPSLKPWKARPFEAGHVFPSSSGPPWKLSHGSVGVLPACKPQLVQSARSRSCRHSLSPHRISRLPGGNRQKRGTFFARKLRTLHQILILTGCFETAPYHPF